jgi:cyclic pyranopterin phosphate synthase
VVIPGVNDDELPRFAAKTMNEEWNVRFIERMPFSGEDASASQFIPVSEIREHLELLGELEPYSVNIGNGPAKYYRLPGANGTIGFITPVSEHFCFQCNRLRLTADGKLRLCLLNNEEMDLRAPLRKGISTEELKKLIEKAIASKPLGHHLAEGDVKQDRPFSQVGG